MKSLDFNINFRKAYDFMENTSKNVFITGKAGTGKSTLLKYFRDQTEKNAAVLAPTGVAAVNVRGQTVHSFFGFKPDITVEKVIKKFKNRKRRGFYKKLDSIVIDEISMVRADLLDCVDRFLRLNSKDKNKPFGGVQMIFFGDLYQLSPVVIGKERQIFRTIYKSPYFFDAHVFNSLEVEFVELEKIYRQSDQDFIDILNGVRNKSITNNQLEKLNTRLDENFQPEGENLFIYLTTTNKKAKEVNDYSLSRLRKKSFFYKGTITGSFEEKSLPTDIDLQLKIGAQIMLVNNDSKGRWINGTVGKIISVETSKDRDNDMIIVKLTSRETVEVTPYTWEMFKFTLNQNTGKIESEIIGSFTQYPIMLAWAITIHKSQGKTFDRAIIDLDRGAFAHGQTYVALSRLSRLKGIILKKPIEKKHILADWRIVKFLTQLQYEKAQETLSFEEKTLLVKKAIKDKKRLKIIYLKPNDEKSVRIIQPEFLGEMEYKGVKYTGIKAHCFKCNDTRNFRVDRMLKIESNG